MSKQHIIAAIGSLLVLAAGFWGCTQPAASDVSDAQRQELSRLLGQITEQTYADRLLRFSNTRNTSSAPDELLAVEEAIIADLEAWNYTVETTTVTIESQYAPSADGMDYAAGPFSMRNIIARKTGNNPELAPVILAAHHDTVAWAPGTNDNGTGCAGVLEAAFALKDSSFERTVIFAFFAFEEDGLIGSEAYAASLSPGELPDSVIVLETIGFSSEKQNTVPVADVLLSMPVVGDFVGVFGSTESRELLLDFLAAAGRDVPGLPVYSIAVDDGMGSNPFLQDLLRSDHSPFWRRSVPALMITDTANLREGNVYHTPNDDYAHVDLAFATKISKAAISAFCVRAGLIP